MCWLSADWYTLKRTLTCTHKHTHANVTCNMQQQLQKVGHWVRKTQAKHAHIFAAVKYFKKGREKSRNNTHRHTLTYKRPHIHIYIHSPKHSCILCRRQKRNKLFFACQRRKRLLKLMIKKKSRKKLITNFNMHNNFLNLFFYYLNKLLNSL